MGLIVALATMSTACSETPPPSPPPTPAAVETPAPTPTAKGKGKKAADPKANMGLDEMREYRRQQKEQGKAL